MDPDPDPDSGVDIFGSKQEKFIDLVFLLTLYILYQALEQKRAQKSCPARTMRCRKDLSPFCCCCC